MCSVLITIFLGTGTALLRCDDKIVLFDLQQKKVLGEVTAPKTKYVVWSKDAAYVALLSKSWMRWVQCGCTVVADRL